MRAQQDSNKIRHSVGAAVLCASFIGAVAGSITIAEPDTDNKAEAFNWYRKAAEQGDAGAQSILKTAENGKIIRQDDSGE